MNQKEWKKSGKFPGKYKWYNKTRKIQKSLKYNSNPESKVIHHLRDTEEQQKYNDEHYELWGFEIDEDGNEHFEYGKYVIFVSKEEHTEIHKCSEETKIKMKENCSRSRLGKHHTVESIEKIKLARSKQTFSSETRKLLGERSKERWQNEEYRLRLIESISGFHHTDEEKARRSAEMKERWKNEEYRQYMSEINSGKNNPMYGKPLSDDHKRKISEANKQRATEEYKQQRRDLMNVVKDKYYQYKSSGGTLSWNEFQRALKNGEVL